MTPIYPTEREPRCDIEAQLIALLAPKHPKRAVWVTRDNAVELLLSDGNRIKRLDLETGTLYASAHDCGRLADDPSEETLAALLDYQETKGDILARGVWDECLVVQARNAQGRVVWEQIASMERLWHAIPVAKQMGRLLICTLDEALARRQRLIEKE